MAQIMHVNGNGPGKENSSAIASLLSPLQIVPVFLFHHIDSLSEVALTHGSHYGCTMELICREQQVQVGFVPSRDRQLLCKRLALLAAKIHLAGPENNEAKYRGQLLVSGCQRRLYLTAELSHHPHLG